MKKIIILIIAVFVQINVYGNTEIECIEATTNDELIEKLSLTPEMSNLRKLSFLAALMKTNFANKQKEGMELTAADHEMLEEVMTDANKNYNKLVDANPEFKKLEANQQKDVFKSSIQKNAQDDLRAIANCFLSLTDIADCLLSAGTTATVVFATCVTLTGAADIYFEIGTGGALTPVLQNVIQAELAACSELAFTTSTIACMAAVNGDIICCIGNKFGYNWSVCN